MDIYNYRNVITFARRVRPADSAGIEKKVKLLADYHSDYDGQDVMDPVLRSRIYFSECKKQYVESLSNFLKKEYNDDL